MLKIKKLSRNFITVAAALLVFLTFVSAGTTTVSTANNNVTVQAKTRKHHSLEYVTDSKGLEILHIWDSYAHCYRKVILRSSVKLQQDLDDYMINNHTDDDKANRPINYSDPDAVKLCLSRGYKPFSTNHLTVYVLGGVPNSLLKKYVREAEKAWGPEITFSFVNNPAKANIQIYYMNKYCHNNPNNTVLGYDQTLGKDRQMIVLFYRTFAKYHFDGEGLRYVIEHEIGHALGLPHDINVESVMYPISEFTDTVEDREKYQTPWVTTDDHRVLRELYHENK